MIDWDQTSKLCSSAANTLKRCVATSFSDSAFRTLPQRNCFPGSLPRQLPVDHHKQKAPRFPSHFCGMKPSNHSGQVNSVTSVTYAELNSPLRTPTRLRSCGSVAFSLKTLILDLPGCDLEAILGQDCSPFQHVGQFAHVARPVVLHQLRRCSGREALHRHLFAQPGQDVRRK